MRGSAGVGAWVERQVGLLRGVSVVSGVPDGGGKYLATHSGGFHCDEALACVFLQLLPAFQGMPVVRSRDPSVWSGEEEGEGRCAAVVDVGGVYDAARLRFDHHQREFNKVYDGPGSEGLDGVKMSSAGLVWKHFGKQVCEVVLEGFGGDVGEAERVQGMIYRRLVREVDANDNGIPVHSGELLYRTSTTLPARVSRTNPSWWEEVEDGGNALFLEAMQLCQADFFSIAKSIIQDLLPARRIVADALSKASSIHPSGSILVLDRFAPWKQHLHDLEEEKKGGGEGGEESQVLYVLFAERHTDPESKWRVAAVPESPESFTSRKALPEPWRGLRGAELDGVTGAPPGAIFVHASGFIGGHATKEGALQMAINAS